MRYARTVFRPRTGMIMGIGAAVVCAVAIVGLFIEVPLHEWIRIAPALALVGVLGVVMFWLPSLTVGPEGITVRNVLRTIEVPWSAVRLVDTKYSLVLETAEGKVTAWAAPSPGRHAAFVTRTAEVERAAATSLDSPRPGDLESTTSGAPATVIRRTLDDLIESGGLGAPEPLRERRHTATIVVLIVLAVGVVASALL